MSLDELLAEFAKTRSGELGDEIELVGRNAIQGYDPTLPRKNFEFHQLWKQLALDPVKRTWCLDTLVDRLPKLSDGNQASYGDKSEAVVERLGVLVTVPPDPRICRAMLALCDLRSPVMGVDADHALIRCLIAHADDRTQNAPQVTELVDSEDNAPLFQGVRLPAPVTAKPRTKATSKRDLHALYAAVYAEPDSDGPREVLADALQEINDPRGEFIALQLREHRGDTSDAVRGRARELCAKYGKMWLGPLRTITYRAEMRRGFLQRLELAGSWSSSKWAELAEEPMLATVEELSRGQATEKIYAAFLAGAIARTVRSIEVFGPEVWNVVSTTPMPRLDHLANTWWGRHLDPNERFKTLIVPWLNDHPQITRLSVTDPKSVAALPKPVASRLRELSVQCAQAAGAKLWAALPKLETLTITPSEATIRFVRQGKREYAHVILERIWAGSGPKLMLPTSIKRIELTNNLRVAKLMVKTYQRRYDVEIVSMPSGTITGVKG